MPRGRPKLPARDRTLPTMGFRPTPKVRLLLEQASILNGRSMSKEIESRLESTFAGQLYGN